MWTLVAEYGGNDTEITTTSDQKSILYIIYEECKPLCEFKICDDIFMNNSIWKAIAIEENTKVSDAYDMIDVDNGNRFYYNEILVSNCALVGESNTPIGYET